MSVACFWYQNNTNWDVDFVRYILDHAAHCKHFLGFDKIARAKVGVILIPGRHSGTEEHYEALRKAGSYFDRVLYVAYGDEESLFKTQNLTHPNKKVWFVMPPFHPKQEVDRVAPNGWAGNAPELIAKAKEYSRGDRPYSWAFQGQMTHSRRIECVKASQGIANGKLLVTEGFTQGVPREEYFATLVRTKLALCPAGPCTPDSFRLCEALEAGCIPIADDLTQHEDYPPGYFQYAFGQEKLPFPLVRDWSTLPEVVEEWLTDWDEKAKKCADFWNAYKQTLSLKMWIDLHE